MWTFGDIASSLTGVRGYQMCSSINSTYHGGLWGPWITLGSLCTWYTLTARKIYFLVLHGVGRQRPFTCFLCYPPILKAFVYSPYIEKAYSVTASSHKIPSSTHIKRYICNTTQRLTCYKPGSHEPPNHRTSLNTSTISYRTYNITLNEWNR